VRIRFAWPLALLWPAAGAVAAPPDDIYHLGPDSEPQAGVPQGKVVGPTVLPSHVYPNTTRQYWAYVPAQYDSSRPACLMIFCDGHAYVGKKGDYRIPYVFDNLIYRREMPVTIGVFINPGHRADRKKLQTPTGAMAPRIAGWNTTHWTTSIPNSSLTSCSRS
jgi:enterochelin esterase family protein